MIHGVEPIPVDEQECLYRMEWSDLPAVQKVYVIWEGLVPGATKKSIMVKYPDGSIAQTSRKDFFTTPGEAIADYRKQLNDAIRYYTKQIEEWAFKIREASEQLEMLDNG